jgi:hypothetical protein
MAKEQPTKEQTTVKPEEGEHTSVERLAAPGVVISRVIEYLPTGGGVVARDCMSGGKAYSKGAVTMMADANDYECTGDKDGSWKKIGPHKFPE